MAKNVWVPAITVVFISFVGVLHGQLCSSLKGLGKCSSNVFTCVFQNGYPQYFKANASTGDCSREEFCCVNLPRPEDGSCAQRCGISGSARQKSKPAQIKLDGKYNWNLMMQGEERSARIVNGSSADKYEFCWQGGIFIVDTEQLQNNSATATPIYVGGASLVGQDMALTAAHVLQPFITDVNFIIFVAFGYRNIEDVTSIMNGTADWDEMPVLRVPNEMAFHSGYNDRTYENNIAIIRFNPISCDTPNVCPICLSPVPANPFQPWKGTCYASGWGATSNASVALTLQKLEMSIPYPAECLKSFMKLGLKNYELPGTMLCADSTPGQRGGTCDRDGGSPLVCQTKYGNWELTGIVGVGINRCRQINAPTLFTNVGYFYDWISSYTKGTYREDQTTEATTVTLTAIPSVSTSANTLSSNFTHGNGNASIQNSTAVTVLIKTSSQSSRSTTRFQFNTPKIFLPKPTPPLDHQQKLVQAFFQERGNDMDPVKNLSVTSVPLAVTLKPNNPVTSSPEFFLTIGNPNDHVSDLFSEASGGVRFFMKAENSIRRRKVNETSADMGTVTKPSVEKSSGITTMVTATTNKPTTASSTKTTVLKSTPKPAVTTVKPLSATVPVPSVRTFASIPREPAQSTRTTASSSVSTTAATATFTTAALMDNDIPTGLPVKTVTNSGYSKIYFHIRPNDNISILSFLRRRYKDSKLYTEAPSSTTHGVSSTPATRINSTTATHKPETSPPVTTIMSKASSLPMTRVTTALRPAGIIRKVTVTYSPKFFFNATGTGNVTLIQQVEILQRPTDSSVMM